MNRQWSGDEPGSSGWRDNVERPRNNDPYGDKAKNKEPGPHARWATNDLSGKTEGRAKARPFRLRLSKKKKK